jgi:hypothetical protein
VCIGHRPAAAIIGCRCSSGGGVAETGTGKTGGPVVELADVVKSHGSLTIDDFTPMREFPPIFNGHVDAGRHYWLTPRRARH